MLCHPIQARAQKKKKEKKSGRRKTCPTRKTTVHTGSFRAQAREACLRSTRARTFVEKSLKTGRDDSEDVDEEKCSRFVLLLSRIAKTCTIV
jgi:hypothetical protein